MTPHSQKVGIDTESTMIKGHAEYLYLQLFIDCFEDSITLLFCVILEFCNFCRSLYNIISNSVASGPVSLLVCYVCTKITNNKFMDFI